MSVKLVRDDAEEPASGLCVNLGDRSLIRENHAVYTFMLVQPTLQKGANGKIM